VTEPMQPVPHDELVSFLTKLPDATAKLLQQHVDDSHGRCLVCQVPMPCGIRAAATAAAEPADARRRARREGHQKRLGR
jgi:hypothetical protein